MQLLTADPDDRRPTSAEARAMCQQISLEIRPLTDPRVISVLNRLRETRMTGGALFASFDVGSHKDFEWFASRDALSMFGILRLLFDRVEVRSALSELEIEPSKPGDAAFVVHRLGDMEPPEPGFFASLALQGISPDWEMTNGDYEGEFQNRTTYLFEAELANALYSGGAYTRAQGDGRVEKQNALSFCDALFDLRFAEVSYYSTNSPWTCWFGNISETWDWTAILFDRRTRVLSILAVTDSD